MSFCEIKNKHGTIIFTCPPLLPALGGEGAGLIACMCAGGPGWRSSLYICRQQPIITGGGFVGEDDNTGKKKKRKFRKEFIKPVVLHNSDGLCSLGIIL